MIWREWNWKDKLGWVQRQEVKLDFRRWDGKDYDDFRDTTDVDSWNLLLQIAKEREVKDYSEIIGLKNQNDALNRE